MFDKIKKLFVVEDEESSKKSDTDKAPKSPDPEPIASSASTQATSDIQVKTSGSPDPKFVEILLKALDRENLQGEDYLEFKQSLQSLSGIDMTDENKYKSAIAMSKTRGADSNKLLQSASHYLNVLKSEESKFLDAAKSQQLKLQQEKTQGITNLKQIINDKQKQIQSLQAQLENDKAALAKMEETVDQSEDKISATISNFQYAYKVIVQQIENDVINIKKNA